MFLEEAADMHEKDRKFTNNLTANLKITIVKSLTIEIRNLTVVICNLYFSFSFFFHLHFDLRSFY